jgi:hypothetical protein
VKTGGGAAWSGDSGSMGDVSMSSVIEAGVISSSRGGVEGDRMGAVGGLFDGGVAGIVAEGGVADGGVADGGVADGGVAVTGRGERIS